MALTKQDQMVIGVAAVAAIGLLVFTMGKDDEEEERPDDEDEVGPLELYVSDDCKTVEEGSNWFVGWAGPRIREAVYAGAGLPLVTNDNRSMGNSINGVVRDVLAPWTDCAKYDLPWVDFFIESTALPMPELGESRGAFYGRMEDHFKAYGVIQSKSNTEFPQLNQLIANLAAATMAVYLDRYHFDPNNLRGESVGGSAGKLTPDQRATVLALGYDDDDNVLLLFQQHFNAVMTEWVGPEWVIDMFLEETNEMDTPTSNALKFAGRTVTPNVPWQAFVAQAVGSGPNFQPPKELSES